MDLPERSVPADAPITAYTLQPPLGDRARDHEHAQHVIYFVDLAWGILSLLLVLRLRLGPRLQQLAHRVARRRFLQMCVFAPLFLLSLAILELPISVWGHSLERRFGLSVQGWGSFARDWGVGQLVSVVIGTFLVWLLYAVMRRAPRRWWLWAWAAMLPVLLFILFLSPFVIEPLFFKFSPLAARDPALTNQLATIAAHAGEPIPKDRMFVMDASEKLRSVNAYVTGLGASKRVVVWDTTLQAMTGREIAFVFGHELGHYVLGHVVIGLLLAAIGLLFVLWLASRTMGALLRRWGPGWSIRRIDEPASLPAILLVATVLGNLWSPAGSAVSRMLEHQADAFGLHAIEGVVENPPQAAAHAFQRLGEIDLAEVDPSPFVVFWLYDHPTLRDRVDFALKSRAASAPSEGTATSPTPPPR